MIKFWQKKSHQEINNEVALALQHNRSYFNEPVIGMPGSHLDSRVFPKIDELFVDAPFLRTLVNNPNHIGCHTLTDAEPTFAGTHRIERELLNIIACDIFKAEENEFDGYVASGGTEANMQAIWIYREYFKRTKHIPQEKIAVLCSTDVHYSIPKACNVLSLRLAKVPVDHETRQITEAALNSELVNLKNQGVEAVIIIATMMTTMFGSVDNIKLITNCLANHSVDFKLHIDGAYGGFYYPFANEDSDMNFVNPDVSSITVDAHKMLQAPYGTGIFLIRKGFMQYTHSKDASYVKGEDYTLVGSRSGANAVAVWMILETYGPKGWVDKIQLLKAQADWICNELDGLNLPYFRQANSNIITLKAAAIPTEVALKYFLVPDDHNNPKWYKIVLMEHVQQTHLEELIKDLEFSVSKA